MSRRAKLQIAAVVGLALLPVGFLTGVGMYHLWDRGWSFVTYWPMALCWLAAYGLGWYWTRRRKPVPAGTTADPAPDYWTDRDKAAWAVVEAHAAGLPALTADQFGDLNRYATDAQALAQKVAHVYKPAAADPLGHLTLPEILACGELVAHDLTRLVDRYVPGSHLLSVGDLKRMRTFADRATEWYPKLRNLYWVGAAVFNPLQVGLQVAAVKGGLAPAFGEFQKNMLLWFYTAYVKELGRYLIELNSGRLKVGAKRYLELLARHQAPPTEVAAPPGTGAAAEAGAEPPVEPPGPVGEPAAPPVTLALVGPVKAGKSSLVNALLGEQRAATDVLPLTPGATRYDLRQPDRPRLTVLDTAGFGNDGASEADVKAAVDAAQQADLLLLVVPARSAARRPETEFLDRVRARLADTPHLKMPTVLAVLSHVDLLSPVREWAPPYDWRAGTRSKEVTIREAVEAAGEQFAGRVAGVVPVCTAAGKELGVADDLLPAIAGHLGEARGVGFLRALHQEAAADRAKRVVGQVLNVGGQVLKMWLDSRKK